MCHVFTSTFTSLLAHYMKCLFAEPIMISFEIQMWHNFLSPQLFSCTICDWFSFMIKLSI